MPRKLAALLLAVLVLAGLGWHFQNEILLRALGFAAKRRLPVGPPRVVAWQTGGDPLGRAASERPPNVVVILADDLGWNDLTWRGGGVAGGTVPTPNIDSIARAGVAFSRGYAANATCAPSRAAILSGRYGTRFGFEFTPTLAGMNTLMRFIGTSGPPRLRRENSSARAFLIWLASTASEAAASAALRFASVSRCARSRFLASLVSSVSSSVEISARTAI